MRRSMFPAAFDMKNVDERMIRDMFDGLCALENRLDGSNHTQHALLQATEKITNKFLFDYEGNKLRNIATHVDAAVRQANARISDGEKTPTVELKTDEELLRETK